MEKKEITTTVAKLPNSNFQIWPEQSSTIFSKNRHADQEVYPKALHLSKEFCPSKANF